MLADNIGSVHTAHATAGVDTAGRPGTPCTASAAAADAQGRAGIALIVQALSNDTGGSLRARTTSSAVFLRGHIYLHLGHTCISLRVHANTVFAAHVHTYPGPHTGMCAWLRRGCTTFHCIGEHSVDTQCLASAALGILARTDASTTAAALALATASLSSGEHAVRRHAAQALGFLRGTHAADALAIVSTALEHPSPDQRRNAAQAMCNMGGNGVTDGAKDAAHQDARSAGQRPTCPGNGDTVGTGASLEGCAVSDVRGSARTTQQNMAAMLARTLLHDPNRKIRRSAAQALGNVGSSVGLGLVQALAHATADAGEHYTVRRPAAWALGRIAKASSGTAAPAAAVLFPPRIVCILGDIVLQDSDTDVHPICDYCACVFSLRVNIYISVWVLVRCLCLKGVCVRVTRISQ